MVHQYFVYIVTNKYRTVLYIGVTNNLIKIIEQHKSWTVEWFSSTYHTNILVYYEKFQYIDKAILREKQLKWRSRKKKDELLYQYNPTLEELSFDAG